MPKNENVIIVLLLFATVMLCYANMLGAGFVWDDEYLVVQNPLVRAPLLSFGMFKQDIVNSGFTTTIYYRPLQILSYAFDYRLWKLHPAGFHFSNIFLHFLNALLVFFFTRKITDNKPLALLTSVLFVTHPAHAGAVSYISGRAEPLYFLFGFLYMLLFEIFMDKKRYVFLAAALISLCLALVSKEGALIFPVILLFADIIMRSRRGKALAWHIPGFAIVSAYAFLHHLVFGARYAVVAGSSGLVDAAGRFFLMAAQFLKIGIVPVGLHMRRLPEAAPVIILIVSAALFFAAVIWMKEIRKHAVFSLVYFAAALLPFALVAGYFGVFAEHWMYLASYGIFLFISAVFIGVYSRAKGFTRGALAAALFSLIMFYSMSTSAQNFYWHDNASLSARVLGFSSSDAPAMHFKAAALLREGKGEEAKEAMSSYAGTGADDARSLYVRGRMLLASGDNAAAESDFKNAVKADPGYGNAYFGLALVALLQEDKDKAVRLLEKAVEINPRDSESLLMLGTIHSESGNNAKALEFTEKAYKINPYDYMTIVNMGTVYSRMGKAREGAEYYLKASELYPEKPVPAFNLGNIFYLSGQKAEAVKWLEKALKADPQFNPALELLKKISEER